MYLKSTNRSSVATNGKYLPPTSTSEDYLQNDDAVILSMVEQLSKETNDVDKLKRYLI